MPQRELARFSISNLQVLDEQGQVDRALEPNLKPDRAQTLYRAMSLAREADSRMLKLQRQGRIGTFAPATGQEAATCGPTFALTAQDWLVSTYRELGPRLMRGEPLEKTLQYYSGYEEGSDFGAQVRMLPTQVILGAQLLHAVGLGYAMRYLDETNTAVLAFAGDGSTSQGDFHEALNFAGVWQAPVVFVCVNNGWAISMPREKQTRAQSIAQKAIAYGIEGIQVDGNDVLGMYRATQEALTRAREGGGPTLIEAVTYRLLMHTTADDPKKYRNDEQEKIWWKKDPLLRFRTYLERKGIWDEQKQQALEAELKEEIAAAVKRFETPTDYAPDAPFDHVFGTPTPELEEQRAQFLAHFSHNQRLAQLSCTHGKEG